MPLFSAVSFNVSTIQFNIFYTSCNFFLIKIKGLTQPAHNFPSTFPYGPILLETSRFLTYFNSAMSGLHLESENIQKFPKKPILLKKSQGRPNDVTLQVSL